MRLERLLDFLFQTIAYILYCLVVSFTCVKYNQHRTCQTNSEVGIARNCCRHTNTHERKSVRVPPFIVLVFAQNSCPTGQRMECASVSAECADYIFIFSINAYNHCWRNLAGFHRRYTHEDRIKHVWNHTVKLIRLSA